jgi:hypothetical protein
VSYPTTVFKTAALSHSAIPPYLGKEALRDTKLEQGFYNSKLELATLFSQEISAGEDGGEWDGRPEPAPY